MTSIELTTEQETVLHEVAARVVACGRLDVLRIRGFSGTGKSTLVAALKSHKFLKELRARGWTRTAFRVLHLHSGVQMRSEAGYISPRKRIKKEGLKVQTFARQDPDVKEIFSGRDHRPPSLRRIRELLSDCWHLGGGRRADVSLAAAVADTLQRFMVSPDPEVGPQHVVLRDPAALASRLPRAHRPRDLAALLVEAAQRLWAAVIEPDSEGGVPPQAYTKYWTLRKQQLEGRWDLIVVEDAQNMSPAVASFILSKQVHVPVVLLGDYLALLPHPLNPAPFTDDANLMSVHEASARCPRPGTTLALRTALRFGPEVVELVNAVLRAGCGGGLRRQGQGEAAPLEQGGAGEGEVLRVPRKDGLLRQSAVYCCLPVGRTPDDATPEDTAARGSEPTSSGPPHRHREEPQGAPLRPDVSGANALWALRGWAPYRPFRFVQCPLRGQPPLEQFPLELDMSAVAPGVSAALPPRLPTLSRWRTSSITVIARRTATAVRLALHLAVDQGRRVYGPPTLRRLAKLALDVSECMSGGKFRGMEGVRNLEEVRHLAACGFVDFSSDLAAALSLAEELNLERGPEGTREALTQLIRAKGMCRSVSSCEYVVTTADQIAGHRAAVVQLAEDFVQLQPLTRPPRSGPFLDPSPDPSELHALYLAVSRPSSLLLLNTDLSRLALALHRRAPPAPQADQGDAGEQDERGGPGEEEQEAAGEEQRGVGVKVKTAVQAEEAPGGSLDGSARVPRTVGVATAASAAAARGGGGAVGGPATAEAPCTGQGDAARRKKRRRRVGERLSWMALTVMMPERGEAEAEEEGLGRRKQGDKERSHREGRRASARDEGGAGDGREGKRRRRQRSEGAEATEGGAPSPDDFTGGSGEEGPPGERSGELERRGGKTSGGGKGERRERKIDEDGGQWKKAGKDGGEERGHKGERGRVCDRSGGSGTPAPPQPSPGAQPGEPGEPGEPGPSHGGAAAGALPGSQPTCHLTQPVQLAQPTQSSPSPADLPLAGGGRKPPRTSGLALLLARAGAAARAWPAGAPGAAAAPPAVRAPGSDRRGGDLERAGGQRNLPVTSAATITAKAAAPGGSRGPVRASSQGAVPPQPSQTREWGTARSGEAGAEAAVGMGTGLEAGLDAAGLMMDSQTTAFSGPPVAKKAKKARKEAGVEAGGSGWMEGF